MVISQTAPPTKTTTNMFTNDTFSFNNSMYQKYHMVVTHPYGVQMYCGESGVLQKQLKLAVHEGHFVLTE